MAVPRPTIRSTALPLTCALLLGALAGQAGAGHTTRSPSALVAALLKAKVATASLPHGYHATAVTTYAPSTTMKSHHAIGGVEIVADSGGEAVIYVVYRSAADAQGAWSAAHFGQGKGVPADRSIPKPSIRFDTSVTGTNAGKKITIGLTDIACRHANVIVQAATSSSTSRTHGDVSGAIALMQFALRHLAAAA